jgi:hypothetical protein
MNKDINFTDDQGNEYFVEIRNGVIVYMTKNKIVFIETILN